MKKYIAIALSIVVFCVLLYGLISNRFHNEQVESNNEQVENTWQTSYISFLNENIQEETNTDYTFSLRDVDNCGIPELLLVRQNSDTALNGILTIYKYEKNSLVKLGDYQNEKTSFIGGFFISQNAEFPGVFSNWWGGGIEHFEYLSIINGELIDEPILIIDRTGDQPEYIELSENNHLINEVLDLYENKPDNSNILTTYTINDEIEESDLNVVLQDS